MQSLSSGRNRDSNDLFAPDIDIGSMTSFDETGRVRSKPTMLPLCLYPSESL